MKYSLAAKASKISKEQKSVQKFDREDKLKSPVLKNVITKIRNSKKTYVENLRIWKILILHLHQAPG